MVKFRHYIKLRAYDYSIQTYSELCDTVVTADAVRQSSVDYLMDKLIPIELQQDDLPKEQDKLQNTTESSGRKISRHSAEDHERKRNILRNKGT